ncbi:MAG: polysaccharide pyruvyl transferase family protein [Rhodothermales bacterium]|nr:polysaccharide pyruvyl transferase family protein [Rhodothermales bacterium]
MKILLINTVLLNGGDAAIMMAIVRQLQAAFGPEAEIEIGEAMPAVSAAYYPDFTLRESLVNAFLRPPRRGRLRLIWGLWRFAAWHAARPRAYAAAWLHARGWTGLANRLLSRRERQAFAPYAGADLIVSTGGTYLVEHYALAPRLFEFDMVRRLGKPLIFYTQSLGPFQTPRYRKRLRAIFDDAALILLRDTLSLAHVRSLGVTHDRVAILPDVVFALWRPPAPRPAGGRLRVAISVRRWAHFTGQSAEAGMAGYRQAVTAGVERLVTHHQAEVVFLSTCQGVPEYAYDDSAEAREVVARLPVETQQRVRVDDAFHRPEELLERLAAFDLVVATRMHMAILSMIAGTPVAPIVYEFKTRELLDLVGYPDWAGGGARLDIETLRAETLNETLDTLITRLPAAREAMGVRVEAVYRQTEEAIARVRAAVAPRSSNTP